MQQRQLRGIGLTGVQQEVHKAGKSWLELEEAVFLASTVRK